MDTIRRLRNTGLVLIAVGLSWISFAYVRTGGFSALSHAPSAPALHKLRVQLKWLHQAQFAGFYVAKEKGYFQKRGLDVTLDQGGPGNNALTAVLSGAADVGVWAPEQVLTSRSAGDAANQTGNDRDKPKAKAIGVVYQQSPACWMVKSDSPVLSFRDITAQVVGTQAQGTDFDILYRAMIARLNMNRSKLKERQVDFNLTLFRSGQVDIWPSYITNEPYIMESQNIKIRCIKPSDAGIDFYGDTIIASDKALHDNEADLRQFMWGASEGWAYALDHIEEAVDITLHWNKNLSKPSQLHMLQESINLIRPSGQSQLLRMSSARWANMQQILVSLGLMSHPVDLDEAFTNGLLPVLP
jgi:NitT/TauT family transport system substrate-binding protein